MTVLSTQYSGYILGTSWDVNGQILRDGIEVRRRWAGYFDQVRNVADVREASINV